MRMGTFQFFGNFSVTVIAIKLKAHVLLAEPHVLVYVLIVFLFYVLLVVFIFVSGLLG